MEIEYIMFESTIDDKEAKLFLKNVKVSWEFYQFQLLFWMYHYSKYVKQELAISPQEFHYERLG